ncbi:MAG TPA: flagellar hook-basal body complex protein [Candidatus Dormibacteraeota bacterium]|nr:flagellar hook-basal body complex protein [Candidatus Dormibacteraeota bacterium]
MAFDSMFTGITGLNAYQSWIDMISNNIANTATTGFKGQRMTFADMFYQQSGYPSGPTATSGGINPQDQGLGVKVNSIDTQFGQGGLETTGVNTDLAINGDGFFILRNTNGTSAPTYTRDGAFSLNSNGLLYDPASGLAVQGYMTGTNGQISQTGSPGNVTIPLGLQEQATATGSGTKVGPSSNDQVFDMAMGGNLDQTQWSQQFLYNVGATVTSGTPKSISTTVYDSLGNAHQATITYTPDVAGATPASVASAGVPNTTGAPTVNLAASQNDTIKIVSNAAGTSALVSDTLGNSQTVAAGQTVTMGGATFTLASPMPGTNTQTVTVTAATNGLPSSVQVENGTAVVPATRWQVSVSFADGTQFSTIATPGTVGAGGAVTAPTYGTGSSGTIGYAYFDQNGQFINSSAIESGVPGYQLDTNATAYLHTGNGGLPAIAQGNQINVTQWGPSAGNNSNAPTAGGAAPTPGPIGLDYSGDASLAGAYTASVVSQNGYPAGTLANITVGQDGTVTGAFTNGQNRALAQVAVATFQNEDGLSRIGGNQFSSTSASGLAQVGTAGAGRFGSIVAGSLEQSNVSLSTEFTNLILAQRAFEANTRGITTADQNLQTVIHLQASEN